MDERQVARFLALGRIVVGTTLVLLPGLAGERWIGPAAKDPAVKVMIRAMGVRDAALGYGTYQALASGERAQTWVAASAASDAVDAVATTLAMRKVGAARAIPLIAVAGAAAVLGARCASTID